MTIDAITRRPDAVGQRQRAVAWSTVLPLAAVMAFADGFWTTSLRGAVGAIERSQSPFTNWWHQSAVALPIYILGVLGAFALAQRWFGPVLPRYRSVAATAVLVIAAGTVIGIAQIAANSAYDYHLQSNQLRMMDSMHGICAGSCLAQAQHATLVVHIHAVIYVSKWILITNLILIAWMVAMLGGRLNVSALRRRGAYIRRPGHGFPSGPGCCATGQRRHPPRRHARTPHRVELRRTVLHPAQRGRNRRCRLGVHPPATARRAHRRRRHLHCATRHLALLPHRRLAVRARGRDAGGDRSARHCRVCAGDCGSARRTHLVAGSRVAQPATRDRAHQSARPRGPRRRHRHRPRRHEHNVVTRDRRFAKPFGHTLIVDRAG